jgi:hypothetical protein
VRKDGQVIRLHGDLVANGEKETSRKQEFENCVNQIDLSGDLGFAVDDIVKAMSRLSVTDAEKRQVEVVKNQINSERLARQNSRNKIFLEQLGTYRDSLEKAIKQDADHDSVKKLSSLVLSIEKLTDSSTAFVDGKSGISTTIKRNANNLILQARTKINEIETSNRAANELNELVKHVNNPVRFASELEGFASRFGDDRNSVGFSRTANEKPILSGLQKWQQLAILLDRNSLESMSPDQAEKTEQQLVNLSKQLSIDDASGSLQQLYKYLAQRKSVPQGGSRMVRQLRSVFAQSSFSKIQTIQRKDGEIRYLSSPFDPQGGTTYRYFYKNASTRSDKQNTNDRLSEAPHCKIARELTLRLEAGQLSDFEGLVTELIATTVDTGPDTGIPVDPIVQCEFLDQILLFAKLTSPSLKPFSEEHRSKIKSQKLLAVDWKAPYAVSDSPRVLAKNFLADFKNEFAELKVTLENSAVDFPEMSTWRNIKNYSAVGFLYQNNSSWKIVFSQNIEPSSKLYCFVPKANGSANFEPIGQYEAGQFKGETSNFRQAGRPVFIFSDKK